MYYYYSAIRELEPEHPPLKNGQRRGQKYNSAP